MKILAVDTSSKICAVSILEDNNVIKESELNNGLTHSENFMPLMEKTLNEAKLTLDDIDLISCIVGPRFFYWNKNRNSKYKSNSTNKKYSYSFSNIIRKSSI